MLNLALVFQNRKTVKPCPGIRTTKSINKGRMWVGIRSELAIPVKKKATEWMETTPYIGPSN